MKNMLIDEKRNIALGATRSIIRRSGSDPLEVTADEALDALHDWTYYNWEARGKVAAEWYDNASESQLKKFKREWNKWQEEKRQRKEFLERYAKWSSPHEHRAQATYEQIRDEQVDDNLSKRKFA